MNKTDYPSIARNLMEILQANVGGGSDEEESRIRYDAVKVAIILGPYAGRAHVYEEQDSIQLYWESKPGDAQQDWSISMYIKGDGEADIIVRQPPNTRPMSHEGVPIDAMPYLAIQPLHRFIESR